MYFVHKTVKRIKGEQIGKVTFSTIDNCFAGTTDEAVFLLAKYGNDANIAVVTGEPSVVEVSGYKSIAFMCKYVSTTEIYTRLLDCYSSQQIIDLAYKIAFEGNAVAFEDYLWCVQETEPIALRDMLRNPIVTGECRARLVGHLMREGDISAILEATDTVDIINYIDKPAVIRMIEYLANLRYGGSDNPEAITLESLSKSDKFVELMWSNFRTINLLVQCADRNMLETIRRVANYHPKPDENPDSVLSVMRTINHALIDRFAEEMTE